MTDLAAVQFRPDALIAASRGVLEARGVAMPPPGMLAAGRAAEAVGAVIDAYLNIVKRTLDAREPEVLAFVRGALPLVDERTVTEAVAAIRAHDEAAAEEAVERMTVKLAAAFGDPEPRMRKARVLAIAELEYRAIADLNETAEERVLEFAEANWVWKGTP